MRFTSKIKSCQDVAIQQVLRINMQQQSRAILESFEYRIKL